MGEGGWVAGYPMQFSSRPYQEIGILNQILYWQRIIPKLRAHRRSSFVFTFKAWFFNIFLMKMFLGFPQISSVSGSKDEYRMLTLFIYCWDMVTCFSDFERSPYNVVKATNPEHFHDLNTDFNHKVEDHWVELIIYY